MAVSGVEQVVEQDVEQEVVGCVALLGLLEPVELQLSLPCRQACSGSNNYILEHEVQLQPLIRDQVPHYYLVKYALLRLSS